MLNSSHAARLRPPPLRPTRVTRPQLFRFLDSGLYRRLTLVTAGAGYGKTTLVAEWVSSLKRPVLWLTLDGTDTDFGRLAGDLEAALGAFGLVTTGQTPDAQTLAQAFAKALETMPLPPVVVLDDWHHLDRGAGGELLVALLDHLPPSVHLVLTSRESVQGPLTRWRVRDLVTEIGALELRFSEEEATDFLVRVMGLTLESQDLSTVVRRTEGWAAGLQLAALALKRSALNTGSFAQIDQWATEVLVDEVLSRIPSDFKEFLVATSLPDRFCVSLADALTGGQSGGTLIQRAVAEHLFLLPVDDERHWFRYHLLFRELLQKQVGGNRVDLHRRASRWFAQNGFEEDAFSHAVQAGDFDEALRLIESQGLPLHFRGSSAVVRFILERVTEADLDRFPGLRIVRAQTRLFGGRPQLASDDARRAELALKDQDQTSRGRTLIGRSASLQATLAVLSHDGLALKEQSLRALQFLDPSETALRSAAEFTLGFGLQIVGDFAGATEAFDRVVAGADQPGVSIYTLAALVGKGQVAEANGQPIVAQNAFQEVVRLAGTPPQRIACEAYLGLARLALFHGDLAGARGLSQQARSLTGDTEGTDTMVSWGLLQVEFCLLEGRAREAGRFLHQAELTVERFGFEFRRKDLERARLKIGEVARRRERNPDGLTVRESEVLSLVELGLSNQQIADRLFLSLHTVKVHLKNLFAKLGVANRTEAAARVRASGSDTPPNTSFEGGRTTS